MYTLSKLTKEYESRRGSVSALRDLSMEIASGEFVTVTGASGSGKTTLLLTLGGLIRPSSGRVLFGNADLGRLSPARLADYRNRKVGFVLQTFDLVPYLSAIENVMLPMIFSADHRKDAAERAGSLLDRMGMAQRLRHLPRELSGGEQQRVAIARALANDPPVILADEPTGNLDPALSTEILGILGDLNRNMGKTVIMVTHSPEAAAAGSRKLALDRGRLN